MKKKVISNFKLWNSISGLCVIGLLFFSISGLTAQTSSLTVISHPVGSPSSIKFSELKSIFMGEKQRWRGGTKISIALMKTNTPVGKITAKKIYGMSGDEVNKFWLALVFQGKAQAPNFFNSADELENFVALNPGAIGILDQANGNDEIKTVLVEGKKLL